MKLKPARNVCLVRPIGAAASAFLLVVVLLLLPAASLSETPWLPSCSALAAPYDCSSHPNAPADFQSGSIPTPVADDDACLDSCASCLGDSVESGRLRIKTFGRKEDAEKHFLCDCRIGEDAYVGLCVDEGYNGAVLAGRSTASALARLMGVATLYIFFR